MNQDRRESGQLKTRRISSKALQVSGLVCAALSIAGFGCTRQSEIVGKWDGVYPVAGHKIMQILEYRSDGTMTQTFLYKAKHIVGLGNYSVGETTLTMVPTGAEIDGKHVPIDASQKMPLYRSYSVSGDILTLSHSGMVESFHREST